jgi:hypothetical protein
MIQYYRFIFFTFYYIIISSYLQEQFKATQENQFCQRMVLRPLFPAHTAPEIYWVCGGGCACGAVGGASPLQTTPKAVLL